MPRFQRQQMFLIHVMLGTWAHGQTPVVPQVDAQTPNPATQQVLLEDFRPNQKLITPRTVLPAAKFPVVDTHTHFYFKLKLNRSALNDFVRVMDANNIAVCTSIDGQLGTRFDDHKNFLWQDYQDRFVLFANINWQGDGESDQPETWACHREGFAKRTAQELAEAVENGASGLKVFKRLGLGYKNPDGSLIRIDDPRWDPIWAACGELGIPVLMHTADPAAFFDPIDATNERWEELSRHPDWSFHGDQFPSRESLLDARNRVIAKHPKTTFIGAHVANNAEDLQTVSTWLDKHPNLVIEFASRIAELGRQPYSARDFLIKYADRIMFGTDGPQPQARLRLYWRFLETRDQSFPYSEKVPPPQGYWTIHGIDLPDDVLRKIYYGNAERIIPGVSERMRQWADREREASEKTP